MVIDPRSHRELLTAREVAEALRMPLSTVYFLADKGDLPAHRIGRTLRFPADVVHRLLSGGAVARRVLVVDDDATVRILAKELLAGRGFDVVEAADVASGLQLARAIPFDALLVDLKLPDGEGSDLIRALLPTYALSQFIVITACTDSRDLEAVLGLGAILLLRKPLDAGHLSACVESIVRSSAPSSAGATGAIPA